MKKERWKMLKKVLMLMTKRRTMVVKMQMKTKRWMPLMMVLMVKMKKGTTPMKMVVR
jgi:hypothetical protein